MLILMMYMVGMLIVGACLCLGIRYGKIDVPPRSAKWAPLVVIIFWPMLAPLIILVQFLYFVLKIFYKLAKVEGMD